jgi:hypothetical protein
MIAAMFEQQPNLVIFSQAVRELLLNERKIIKTKIVNFITIKIFGQELS